MFFKCRIVRTEAYYQRTQGFPVHAPHASLIVLIYQESKKTTDFPNYTENAREVGFLTNRLQVTLWTPLPQITLGKRVFSCLVNH